jgi:hypothetical protein
LSSLLISSGAEDVAVGEAFFGSVGVDRHKEYDHTRLFHRDQKLSELKPHNHNAFNKSKKYQIIIIIINEWISD